MISKIFHLLKLLLTPSGLRTVFHKLMNLFRLIRSSGWKVGFWKILNFLKNPVLFQDQPGNWSAAQQYIGSRGIPENSYESHYEDDEDFSGRETDIKALAFYLPQFHSFPENDLWWGKGFTEWTNTRKAVPQYPSHYQPREPHDDIGYYDLSDWHTLEKQAAMVKRHGLYGLCIYHYWFSGKQLMEKPLNLLLEHPEIDLKFCLCWANENWTRTWDGLSDQVLIAQRHENDDVDYIKDVKKYLLDKRYIRVNGEALLLVYRPGILPDAAKTFRKWREWAMGNGIGKIHLLVVRGCANTPDSVMVEEADGEVEFPPSYTAMPTVLKSNEAGMQILSYPSYVNEIISGHGFTETYRHPVYRGAMLGWDCTPRRKAFHGWYGFSPERYYQWLCYNIRYTRKHHSEEDRFIFINAWNEWAEGTYLEPDKLFGYTNLNTTSRALFGQPLKTGITPEDNLVITKITPYYDQNWYLKTYPDIARSGLDPVRHFAEYGWREGRSPSEHFPNAVYLFYHPELKSGTDGPLVSFLHRKLPESCLGNLVKKFDLLQSEVRQKLKIRLLIPPEPEKPVDLSGRKIAVHLHCFYPDMIPQICANLNCLPGAFDLFVSIPDNRLDDPDLERRFRKQLPQLQNCEIQVCPNRGRDIAPMICTFGRKLLNYDFICHIHTKKSLHTPQHARWAEFIFDHLFWNRNWMERIFYLLTTDAKIVYPPDYLLMQEEPSGWGSNLGTAQNLLDKAGKNIDLENEFPLIEFPQGSMFWGSSEALQEMLQLPLTYEDFPNEPLGTDGSLAHALERLFFIWSKDHDGFNYQIFRPGEEDMITRKRYWYSPLNSKKKQRKKGK